MEWAIFTRQNGQKYFRKADDKEVALALKYPGDGIRRESSEGMMSNGARYYRDLGHPEYATPEDTSFMGTVANEFAGEKVVYDSFVAAQNTTNDKLFDEFILNKRVVDDELNTWGYHISLCAEADSLLVCEEGLAPLGVHLSTMNIYCGAGAVIPSDSGAAEFTVSQKTLNLNTDFNGSSHGSTKPLISTRVEPLANKNLYERFHVTSMDANMSPWATWMKIGTISIVLRMREHNYLSSDPYFSIPMHQVALGVAHDPDFTYKAKLADGTTIRPIDIQINLVQLAEKFRKDYGLPEEEERVLHEWKRVLTDLQIDPRRTFDRVEWVLKREVLHQYMARQALRLSDTRVLNLDRRWSDIGPNSIGKRLRESRWAQWMPSEESLHRAYYYPPATTRAFGRAALIYKYGEFDSPHLLASWGHVSYKNKTWDMDDPYIPQVRSQRVRSTDPIQLGPDEYHDDDFYDALEA